MARNETRDSRYSPATDPRPRKQGKHQHRNGDRPFVERTQQGIGHARRRIAVTRAEGIHDHHRRPWRNLLRRPRRVGSRQSQAQTRVSDRPHSRAAVGTSCQSPEWLGLRDVSRCHGRHLRRPRPAGLPSFVSECECWVNPNCSRRIQHHAPPLRAGHRRVGGDDHSLAFDAAV